MSRPRLWATVFCSALACSGAPRGPSIPLPDTAAGAPGAPVAGTPAGAAGVGVAGSVATAGRSGTTGGASGASAGAGADLDDAGTADAAPRPAAGSGGGGGVAPAPRSTGPGDWVAGDYPPDLQSTRFLEISGVPGQGQNVRQYKVHVPPSYDPMVPAPLVFCIHGLGQDALLFCVTGAAMHTQSDQGGFILVMPNGFQNSWNAGTCCGEASAQGLDDVALFRAIFAEVGKHLNIDLNRVYATGLSNGGYMSYRLACEAADVFTAIAPAAAAIGKNDIGGGTNPMSDFTSCEPSQPVSVLHVHGTADPLIAFDRQPPTLRHIATKNGCATTTKPATEPRSGGDTTCVTHEGCPSGVEVTACTIEGGGHCWFGSEDCGTGGGPIGLAIVGANSDTMKNTPAVWDFFKDLSR